MCLCTQIPMAYLTLFSIELLVVSLSYCAFVQSDKFSFTAELIHRDSPNSPFYNASETSVGRLANALQRYAYRVSSTGYRSNVISGDGNYLMKISIGTPPTQLFATVETAGNILWIPCKDCSTCTQKSKRIFNSLASSTYKNAPCDSRPCLSTNSFCQSDVCLHTCDRQNQQNCPQGRIAMDTITLSSTTGNPLVLPDSSFICANQIGSEYPGFGTVGLGSGPLSLTSRLHNLIDGQFSYCLVPYGSGQSSKLVFGEAAFQPYNGRYNYNKVLTTPLGQDSETGHYYVTLTGISIEGTAQYFLENRYDYPGGMIIDSDTMFTQLPKDFLNNFWVSLAYSLPEDVRNNLYLDDTLKLSPCFRYTHEFRAPKITLHFLGADLELDESNTFIKISDNITCVAFAGADDDDEISVLGSWQQTNYLMGYDLEQGTLTMKKTDCSTL